MMVRLDRIAKVVDISGRFENFPADMRWNVFGVQDRDLMTVEKHDEVEILAVLVEN
jgi:hypothetical protein